MPMIADDPVVTALTPTLIAFGLYLAGVAIWPRPTALSRPLMLSISAALTVQYTWWRITETLPPAALSVEYAIAIGFLLAETAGMSASALSLLFLFRTRDRSADANAGWLENEARSPPVDVLICSYNEEQSILERTIVGALAMDYPNFRVFMLDDSRRGWLKDLSARLAAITFPARTTGTPRRATSTTRSSSSHAFPIPPNSSPFSMRILCRRRVSSSAP
jgi:cellulose synthase (UDP-forming)